MQIDFLDLMSKKSDEGLQRYIDDISKFVPEAIEAAIAELQKRGRKFSEDELSALRIELQKRREAIDDENRQFLNPENEFENNIVTDVDKPMLYSKKLIFSSTIFCALLGSILLAINIRRTASKKGVIMVVIFGIGFTVLQSIFLSNFLSIQSYSQSITLARYSPLRTYSTLGVLGGVILSILFWDLYIGNDVKYRERPSFLPIALALIYLGILIWYFSFIMVV